MDYSDIGVFALAERRMKWADQRQSVLAQNIANANTPGFKAHEIGSFAATLAGQGVSLAATDPAHFGGSNTGSFAVREQTTSGKAPNGNTVAMEEQLGKVADTASTQELVTNLYSKYRGLFRLVLGRNE